MTAYEEIEDLWEPVDALRANEGNLKRIIQLREKQAATMASLIQNLDDKVAILEKMVAEARTKLAAIEAAANS